MMKRSTFFLIFFFIGFLISKNTLVAQSISGWKKLFGGSHHDAAHSLQQTKDEGYIIAGGSVSNDGDVGNNYGEHDVWIFKLDMHGNLEWENNYGGSGADFAYSIQQTTDGGYIIASRSTSNDGDVGNNYGEYDAWIIKLNIEGEIEWEKNYGGSKSDYVYSVQQTEDGGYIIAGNSNSDDGDIGNNYGSYDAWIFKLNSDGNLEWENNYGGSDLDHINQVQQTEDGGYILAGWTQSNDGNIGDNYGEYDAWIIKLNTSGNLLWEKSYGGSSLDYAHSIQQTTDYGYIVGGWTQSNDGDIGDNYGEYDAWVIKLDNEGTLLWEKSYGGSKSDYTYSIQQTEDGGYIAAGKSASDDGDVNDNYGQWDVWVFKLDSEGNLEWENNYGGSSLDYAYSVQQTEDGSYIFAGHTASSDGDIPSGSYQGQRDCWVVKIKPISTEVSEPHSNSKIMIAPNPSKGKFIMNINPSIESVDIEIFDILGHSIYIQNDISNTLELDNIPKGNYYIHIKNEYYFCIKKLIIL